MERDRNYIMIISHTENRASTMFYMFINKMYGKYDMCSGKERKVEIDGKILRFVGEESYNRKHGLGFRGITVSDGYFEKKLDEYLEQEKNTNE